MALEGREADLPGFVSPPFGVFRGTAVGQGIAGCHRYTLVYVPQARIHGDVPHVGTVPPPCLQAGAPTGALGRERAYRRPRTNSPAVPAGRRVEGAAPYRELCRAVVVVAKGIGLALNP